MRKNKKTVSVLLVLALAFTAAGCGTSPRQSAAAGRGEDLSSAARGAAETLSGAIAAADSAELFTERDLGGEYGEYTLITLAGAKVGIDGEGAEVRRGAVAITAAGTYLLRGSLLGQILIDAPEDAKVQLVLDGAAIENDGAAAIAALSADKLFITLAPGSENSVSAKGTLAAIGDADADGAIWAKCDLTINGAGALAIYCESGHGVVTKDDLRVVSSDLRVEAAKRALSGKDSVAIASGTLELSSGTDGIHSDSDKDGKGYIAVLGGDIAIVSAGDGLDASLWVSLEGGRVSVTSGGGAQSVSQGGYGGYGRGAWSGGSGSDVSAKGVKGDAAVYVSGGELHADSADDALHTNGETVISGGTLELASGDDGVHADVSITVSGGVLTVSDSCEGLEAAEILITGGEIRIKASDDGLNASGGRDGSALGGPFGGDPFAAQDASIAVSGGTLYLSAGGDGVDSNGDLTVSGGEIYVSGPTNGGNGALDYNGRGVISGGVLVAAGAWGMAENFSADSTQCSLLVAFPATVQGGQEIRVYDADGAAIVSYAPEKEYQCAVISAPGLRLGETVTVTAGGYSQSVTISSVIVGGQGGFGGGPGGGPEGGRGGGPGGGPGRRGGGGRNDADGASSAVT